MSYRTCLVSDCATDMSGGYLRKGYCERHYYHWRKYGTPSPTDEQKRAARRSRAGARGSIYSHVCAVCQESFESLSKQSKYCSNRCRNRVAAIRSGSTCSVCNEPMWNRSQHVQGVSTCLDCRKQGLAPVTAKHGTVYRYSLGCKCADCAGAKRAANSAHRDRVITEHGVNPATLYRRRYRERTGRRYPVDAYWDWISVEQRYDIYERDGYVCHLCGDSVDREAHYNDDYAPSLDHIIPRSAGGSDDPENLKTAHRVCNSIRQDAPLLELEVV